MTITTPPELCDAEAIVRLLKAGDVAAMDAVTRCFGERLMAAATRHCRSREEADDAVQEAALAAWRYGPGFRGEGAVDRWLVRLVASACSRMRRGLKRDAWLHVPLHIRDAELLAEDADPELLAARAELAEALAGALAALPPRDRTIVLLADGQGWTGPEIAEALEMSHGAVRTRLSRAHARLREALGERGITPPG